MSHLLRRKMKMTDKTLFGLIGTGVGAVGAGLSVNELQAIISIVVTILGFLISVAIPWIIKLVKWWKKSKKDGEIDEKELEELEGIIKEGSDEIEKHKKK